MNLKTYIEKERGRATVIASALGWSLSYLSQMASGKSSISPEKAVLLEQITEGVVSRKDSRPDDWQKIWPELVDKAA